MLRTLRSSLGRKTAACTVAGLALAATLLVEQAWAVRIYWAINNSTQTSGGAVVLQLGTDHAGNEVGESWVVKVKKAGPGVIMFNAECSVDGDNATSVDIDILVDGEAVGPTAAGNALCTGHDTGSNETWVSAAVIAPTDFKPGNRKIQVRASIDSESGGGTWRIDDMSLTLILEKK